MSQFNAIDLSQLPPPAVVEQLDFEQIFEARKAYAVSLWPPEQQADIAARLALDSEPLTKLLQENAYREMVWRQRVNEAALANLLATARGADLDQLAANVNVRRQTLRVGSPTALPPTLAMMEGDDSLRERVQLAWEGLSTAGPRQSYVFHARDADGQVADASAESPSPATVVVTVQSTENDGVASPALLEAVAVHLSDEDRRPVGDRLIVQAAEIISFEVSAVLYLSTQGPEAEPVLAAARTRLLEYVHQRRRLGMQVVRSGLHAALHIEGVRRVELQGWTDILATTAQAPFCTAVHLTQGETR
jgi:phage-related baseplate assembly protein